MATPTGPLTVQSAKALVPSLCGVEGNVLQPLVDGANVAVARYCNRSFDLAQSFTDYLDLPPPGGRNEIILPRRPCNSVTSVNVDPRGGYGQLTNTFGSETLLEAGVAYYYEPGTSILRILQFSSGWPGWGGFFGAFGQGWWGPQGYPFGCNARNAMTGTVKVVYNAGWTDFPSDLVLATAQIVSWLQGGAMESGGTGQVTSYIDVSTGGTAAVDALAYGNVPSLGTARQILNTYRETAAPSPGRW